MKKIAHFLSENILLIASLFLIAFIPLYPKLPLINVEHTWVYIRIDDFVVALSLVLWGIQLLRKKASLRTPLTIPILIFWIAGFVSTVFSIIFYFPHIPGAYPSLAILYALRHVEYMSLFFLAFSSMRQKNFIHAVVAVTVVTLIIIVGYGYGQRFAPTYFPAFSTMNEEFAKGIPLLLSPLGRVQATFAGHYDLAAYLVMMIPLLGSLAFGYRKWWIRIVLVLTSLSGVILLLMTASRTSFAVYLLAVIFMLIIQKQKKFIIPVIIISFLLLQSFQGLYQRYTSTISSVDLIVDARTGKPVGIAKKDSKELTIEDIQSTGENLPQGSGYINFPSQQVQTSGTVVYKKLSLMNGKESLQTTNLEGKFVVKKALAYDVSFTTRFQGEWPRAIEAFKRNILLGSGYSSISLATDGNYLRILGEVGLLGFTSFLLILLTAGIYLYRVLPSVNSPVARSFLLGTSSALVGLMLNAVLIDVFEGSKVAYTLWLFMGISIGILALYQEKKVHFLKEFKQLLLSPAAILLALLLVSFGVFSMILSNFFVADDFTWLRWVGECRLIGYTELGVKICEPAKVTILHFFTDAGDFFYRPGTKFFFYIAYALSGMNPTSYHVFSILAHFASTLAVFLLSMRLLKSKIFALYAAIIFLVVSSHFETIVWISSIGHLATAMFCLLSLLFYAYWRDGRSFLWYGAALLCTFSAPLFHESGIIAPLIIIAYECILKRYSRQERWKYSLLLPFIAAIPLYLVARQMAGSLWSAGDYKYNIAKLPLNIVGNTFSYAFITFIGAPAISFATSFRNYFKDHIALSAALLLLVTIPIIIFTWSKRKKIHLAKLSIPLFAIAFFLIALLPFAGLGNVTSRYVYLASFGAILLFVWAVQQLYLRLASSQQKIGGIVLGVLLLLFGYYHFMQMQSMNKDWEHAGQIGQSLLTNFNYAYVTQEHITNPVFYFVDTPVSYGHAWVFPTGLRDVLWFTFQDDFLTVHQGKDLELALDQAEGSTSARIFRFSPDGSVEQVSRVTPTPIPVPGAIRNGR